MKNKKIKVSVCVITYNHERFIEECLTSIVSQKTNFDFEVIIGEDLSTDETLKKILDFSSKYPFIKLLNNSKNLGALPNFIRTLKAATGEYIAFCEGDDYWIDEHKLQKQVNFLEQNTEYGGVCSNNDWYDERSKVFMQINKQIEESITFETLARNNVINSQSILFERKLLQNIDWLQNLKIGDWAIHLIIANQKPYFRLKEIMTVYRVHPDGIHSLSPKENKLSNSVNVLKEALKNLNLTHQKKKLITSSIHHILKNLISLNTINKKLYRKEYFAFNGRILNKTIIKSYLK